MEDEIRQDLEAVRSGDREAREGAYGRLMAASEGPVDWAGEAWDGLLADLGHEDNHVRAIAAQLLCNLARSQGEAPLLAALPALVKATRDGRFVTARHSLQALWKVGLAGPRPRARLLEALTLRFAECADERNGTLLRYDLLEGLYKLYAASGDQAVRSRALALIEIEAAPKYRKKYSGLWKRR